MTQFGVVLFAVGIVALYRGGLRTPVALALGAYTVVPHLGNNVTGIIPLFGSQITATFALADVLAVALLVPDVRRHNWRATLLPMGLLLLSVALPSLAMIIGDVPSPAWLWSAGNILRLGLLLSWAAAAWSDDLQQEVHRVFTWAVVSVSTQILVAPFLGLAGEHGAVARPLARDWGNLGAGYFLALSATIILLSAPETWAANRTRWRCTLAAIASVGAYATGARLPLVLIAMALAFSLVAELRSGRGGQLAVGGTVAAVTVGLFLLPAGGIPSLQAVDRALANDPVTTVSGMVTGENSQFMSDEGASSEFRSAMRALALKEVERRPLLGAGWGTWGFVGEPAMVGVATHPHNDVLLILVEGGLIGALLLYAGVCILWTRRTGPLNPTHYALVVFAGVTAMSSPMLPIARGAAVPLLLMTQWRTPTRVGVDE